MVEILQVYRNTQYKVLFSMRFLKLDYYLTYLELLLTKRNIFLLQEFITNCLQICTVQYSNKESKIR